MKEDELKFHSLVLSVPLFFVFIIWLIYSIEIGFDFNFNKYGVYPRTLSGFKGVFLMHFIHGNANHLFNNSVPLVVLIASLFYFYKDLAWKIVIYGGVLTGVLTWLIARESYHIGASGLVYLLFSFVFFSGMIRKHFRLVALSLIIIFLYGSMVWYILPIKEGMSWEGHLSGFLIGLLFSLLFRKKGIIQQEFQFSKTDFDELFDSEGNFISQTEEEHSAISEKREIN